MFESTISEGFINPQGYRHMYALDTTVPLVEPRRAAWNGINIEHHRQPPAECKLRLPEHAICILLRECHTERRVDSGHMQHNYAASGEVIIYPASSEQWIRWQADTEFLLLFLDPSYLTQAADGLSSRKSVEIIESEKEVSDPLLQQIGLALKAEIDDGLDPSSALYTESLTHTLSAHLLRRYAVWKPGPSSLPQLRSAPNLHRVVEYIHDNIDQQLTLAELALIANMSTYHFARTFKQFMGVTPHQYVLNVRIERAKSLLLQGKLPLSEIASKVGFFDQSHFTRAFKRLVGVTPQALLREKGKNLQ